VKDLVRVNDCSSAVHLPYLSAILGQNIVRRCGGLKGDQLRHHHRVVWMGPIPPLNQALEVERTRFASKAIFEDIVSKISEEDVVSRLPRAFTILTTRSQLDQTPRFGKTLSQNPIRLVRRIGGEHVPPLVETEKIGHRSQRWGQGVVGDSPEKAENDESHGGDREHLVDRLKHHRAPRTGACEPGRKPMTNPIR
jgi:hypothetical protein